MSPQHTSTKRLWNQVGSGVVVISYFLVWHKSWAGSEIGFQLFASVFAGLKDMTGDAAFLMLLTACCIVSPLVCHVVNLWTTFTSENKRLSFVVSAIPAASWLALVAVLLVISKGDTFILEMSLPHEIGGLLAMAGMTVSAVFAGLEYSDSGGDSRTH